MKKIITVIALSLMLASCANINFNDMPIKTSHSSDR